MVNLNRESKKNTHPLSGVRVPYGTYAIYGIFSMYCIVGFISTAKLQQNSMLSKFCRYKMIMTKLESSDYFLDYG